MFFHTIGILWPVEKVYLLSYNCFPIKNFNGLQDMCSTIIDCLNENRVFDTS